ncbi:hypothetical protein C8R45DRAFT_943283 [Mycena sanguinolenta]|nr:hypothetical protein C8R45DRAFT_943283 [Mycena sanguinolenta]
MENPEIRDGDGRRWTEMDGGGRRWTELCTSITDEEIKEMVAAVMANRKRRSRGTRANNLAAQEVADRWIGHMHQQPQRVKRFEATQAEAVLSAFGRGGSLTLVDACVQSNDLLPLVAATADARRTMEHLKDEITCLAERVGMIGFAIFSHGHVHDKMLPATIQSLGALDFIREVLKKEPADVAHLFALWAVSRERGTMGKNKLLSMQQEATSIITMGLIWAETVLGVTRAAMNYESYISKLVRGKGVGLVNWLEGVEFKRMSKQSAVGPLQNLLDSLKCGTTRWKVLMAGEKQRLIEQWDEMVENGDVEAPEKKSKARKAKAKKSPVLEDDSEEEEEEGGRDSEEEDEPRVRKAAAKSSCLHKAASKSKPVHKPPARADNDNDNDNDDNDDDVDDRHSRKAVPKSKPARRPSAHAATDDRRSRKAVPKKLARKPPACADDDDDDHRRSRKAAPKSKPTGKLSVQDKLRILVEEANSRARKRSGAGKAGKGAGSRAGKENTTKRKRKQRGDSEEERGGKEKRRKEAGGAKRKRGAEEETAEQAKKKMKRIAEEESVTPPRPVPRPLYSRKKATDAPATANEGAPAPSSPAPDRSPSPDLRSAEGARTMSPRTGTDGGASSTSTTKSNGSG